MRFGEGQWERDGLWDCDPMSVVQISCQILDTMPCLAGEEPSPTWLGLPSHMPCGLVPSSLIDKARSCSSQLAERMLTESPSASAFTGHIKMGKAFPVQFWDKDVCCVWSHIPTSSHSRQSLSTLACSSPPLSGLTPLESSFFPSSPSRIDSLPYY